MDAYAILIVSGLTFANVSPMPMTDCEELKSASQGAYEITCVEKEPDCGKSTGTPCLGRADLEPTAKKPTAKKRSSSRSRSRTTRR